VPRDWLQRSFQVSQSATDTNDTPNGTSLFESQSERTADQADTNNR
jgi:hypothetical protein